MNKKFNVKIQIKLIKKFDNIQKNVIIKKLQQKNAKKRVLPKITANLHKNTGNFTGI